MIKNKVLFFIGFLIFVFSLQVVAEDKEIEKLFTEQDVNGTIVIASLHTGQKFVYNESRANQKFSTASTFKIVNTLIALEEKVVSGKDTLLRWDGQIYEFPDWNHDQTLESAFKVSCVWCFQDFARRIGADKYRTYLDILDYGTLNEPFEETTFWLDGSLQISAIEQVEFLKKVYLRSFPFSASTYETLQQIMLIEKTPSFTIRAKTGWATRLTSQIGWYVGYIETASDVWFFAINLDINEKNKLGLRQKLTLEALKTKGIIE
jgi:beta-lactamase class D